MLRVPQLLVLMVNMLHHMHTSYIEDAAVLCAIYTYPPPIFSLGSSCTDDTTLLGKKPSLMLLRNIVVPKVSANWMTVVVNLDIKDSRLSAIEKSKPHQTDACCTEMFSIWLGQAPWHTGGLPLTWSSVLSAIEKVDSVTSKELLAELKSIVEAHPVR